MSVRMLTAIGVLACSVCFAADSKSDAAKMKGKKLDLGLPKTFNALPTGEGLEKPKDKSNDQAGPTTKATDVQYQVVSVVNGKSFLRTATGAKPSTPFEQVNTEGNPPTTEKFSTVVRVRCISKVNASIDVVILDPRSDTLMDASGELFFRNQKDPELDWTVDWERTQLPRGPGAYQVLIRVAGQPMGTFPLKIAEPGSKADAGAKTDPPVAK